MNLKKIIKKDIENALVKLNFKHKYHAVITSNKKIKLGHYQLNNLIKIADIFNLTPYSLSKKIILNIQNKPMYQKITFSQPGFINIFIRNSWLSEALEKVFYSYRLDIKHENSKTVVIDYSSPNIAKEMHVGHLRSTIIGDVMVRVLTFLGHHVIKANHIGDWGTQFGMLIAYLKYKKLDDILKKNNFSLLKLEELYCKAKKKYDNNTLFSEKSRKYVVKLQNGDQFCRSIWKKLVFITMQENYKIYTKLNVTLNQSDTMGESLYNNMLPDITQDLKNKKIAIEKNGTTIVFLKEFKNRLGQSMGVVIQKKRSRIFIFNY